MGKQHVHLCCIFEFGRLGLYVFRCACCISAIGFGSSRLPKVFDKNPALPHPGTLVGYPRVVALRRTKTRVSSRALGGNFPAPQCLYTFRTAVRVFVTNFWGVFLGLPWMRGAFPRMINVACNPQSSASKLRLFLYYVTFSS